MYDSTYSDIVETLENQEGSFEEQAMAMQRAINSGICWSLQGSFGRMSMDMMRSGVVMLGELSRAEAYGNRVPSRYDIKPGAFGSREYVVEHYGEGHADMLETA
jgi:hypothetical protein